FLPKANFFGTATLRLRAWDRSDGKGNATRADVSTNGGTTAYSTAFETAWVRVTPVNDAPVLNPQADLSLVPIAEDVTDPAGTLIWQLLNGSDDPITDIDPGALEGIAVVGVDNRNGTWQYSVDSGATWRDLGAASESAAVLLAAGATERIRFVPAANFHGTVDPGLTVRAWDRTDGRASGAENVNVAAIGTGGTTPFSAETATVSIEVASVNDPPVADDETYTTDEDRSLTIVAPGVLAGDTDVDGDSLTAVLQSGPAHGTVTLDADGGFVYTPDADWFGTDAFTYRASDGEASSNVATVTITVRPVNDRPVGGADAFNTDEDSPLTVPAPGLIANDTDVDGDGITIVRVNGQAADVGSQLTLASGARLTVNADGSLSYDPNGQLEYLDDGEQFTETFTYTPSDGTVEADPVAVTITVSGRNDAPVGTADAYSTDDHIVLNVAPRGVLVNDTDADDAEALQLTVVAVNGNPGAVGTTIGLNSGAFLTMNADGSFTYDPTGAFRSLDAGQTAVDTFTYTPFDGTANGQPVTVT
ncbi:MAG TPA: tandem-95 repeat protein, partial [Planctomycetaceae bacterium]|nr:tandem-95 repeat protein [Planctomycetaceae bacterium]